MNINIIRLSRRGRCDIIFFKVKQQGKVNFIGFIANIVKDASNHGALQLFYTIQQIRMARNLC